MVPVIDSQLRLPYRTPNPPLQLPKRLWYKGDFAGFINLLPKDTAMITHVVMMKFKPEVTAEAIGELEALLNGLPDRIQEIQSYDFGRDVVRSERSWDFALVAVFANLDTLKHYQIHPDHQVVLEKLGGMCAQIAAVDYENAPYGEVRDGDPDPWQSKTLFQRP